MKIEAYTKQSILLTVSKSYSVFWKQLEKKLKADNCSVIGAIVLIAIWSEKRSVTPSELSRSLDIGRSNVSQALRRLEREKFIKRSLSEIDARSYKISLTSFGEKRSLFYVSMIDKIESQWESSLGQVKTLELIRGLQNLVSETSSV